MAGEGKIHVIENHLASNDNEEDVIFDQVEFKGMRFLHLGCFPKSTKKNFFQLKHYSDRVLSLDSEYMTQSGQIGR